ncbi:MAG: MOSC domain-containing protein [Proteobacteria bacterium]|nr:MOSC domain-containing protein [Pseudomonadota bacterium]HQR04081.1 MOSC domain-containing protein [Rhodocyclaceae bacterium]
MQARIHSVQIGPVRPLGATQSGIVKAPVSGPQRVGRLGLDGDQQADMRVHGGEDKAVLCYARAHHDYWREALPGHPLLEVPGAFGENLSIDDLDENTVCIGDRWRIGGVLFSVTQGRLPCYKLNLRFGVPDMAARVQASVRTGWYLRVLEPGSLQEGDRCDLLDRPHPDATVATLLTLIRDRETRHERLEPILALPLPPSWRRLFEKRMQTREAEDWKPRLHGKGE